MIIRLRRKTYSEFGDRLKNSIKMSGTMATAGTLITLPFGMISWKIPLVTASLFAAMGANYGWKNAYIKLKKEEFEDLNNIYPVTKLLTEASSLEKSIEKEVNQLLELYEKYNIVDISRYSIPSLYTNDSIGRDEYKKLKTSGKMHLLTIGLTSGPRIEYYVHSNGQLKRHNGKVVNGIQDIKKDLIEAWKLAKKDWYVDTFGYGTSESEIEDITGTTPEEIERMKTEIPKAFDVVINKLMRS